MQVVTVPKEVIWATRLTWAWLASSIVVNYILSGIFKMEALLIHLMVALPIVALILGVNYFLSKGKKWALWMVVLYLCLSTLWSLAALALPISIEDHELRGQSLYVLRIIFGLLVVYLLIKQRIFFNIKIN